MTDYSGTTTVSVEASVLFDYLSDVANLPKYFSRMTSAAPGDGEEVHTTATMPDGTEVEGDAWFRVDTSAQRLEWGSEGPSDYSGDLEVHASGATSEVEVHIRTSREGIHPGQVEDGIAETLAAIKQQVEHA